MLWCKTYYLPFYYHFGLPGVLIFNKENSFSCHDVHFYLTQLLPLLVLKNNKHWKNKFLTKISLFSFSASLLDKIIVKGDVVRLVHSWKFLVPSILSTKLLWESTVFDQETNNYDVLYRKWELSLIFPKKCQCVQCQGASIYDILKNSLIRCNNPILIIFLNIRIDFIRRWITKKFIFTNIERPFKGVRFLAY